MTTAPDRCKIRGTITLVHTRRDPETDAVRVLERRVVKNLITQYGDQFYGERASGIGAHTVPSGMKLGTGTTAVAKTGAGAATVTYLTGSNRPFVGGFPASSLEVAARRIEYQSFWDEGVATSATIAEVMLTNQDVLADDASVVGDTIARHVFSPVIDKQATDTLTITWAHDLEGV